MKHCVDLFWSKDSWTMVLSQAKEIKKIHRTDQRFPMRFHRPPLYPMKCVISFSKLLCSKCFRYQVSFTVWTHYHAHETIQLVDKYRWTTSGNERAFIINDKLIENWIDEFRWYSEYSYVNTCTLYVNSGRF